MPSPHAAQAERAEPILNPLAWVQFRLAGGFKRFWGACGLYAGAFVFFNVFIYRGIGPDVSLTAFASNSLTLTLYIAALMFILVGSGVINRAILRDFSSDMITSHRSTAMSGRAVVVGYLFGPTLGILGFTAVNWMACTVLAQLAGFPFYLPTIVFVCVSTMALMVWTLTVLAGLSFRGKLAVAAIASPALVIIAIGPLGQILSAHPGAALIMNHRLISSFSSTAARGINPTDVQSVLVAMMFQVVMAIIFFLAASRKFQRDDVTAFNMPLAYVFLALCTLLCAVGLEHFSESEQVGRFSAFSNQFSLSTKFLSTIVSLAVLALLPVTQACLELAQWSKRKARDPLFTAPKPRPYWEVAFTATIIVLGILSIVARWKTAESVDCRPDMSALKSFAYLGISLFLAVLTVAGVMRFAYSFMRNGMWILLLFLVIAWILPMIGDLLLEVAQERMTPDKSLFFTISPIGSWIVQLTGGRGPLTLGLISQAAIAVAAQMLALKARH